MSNSAHPKHTPVDRSRSALLYGLAFLALLLFALAFLIANARTVPLTVDELLGSSLITQPTAAALIHFERTTPIWFDPPAFALLVHSCWKAFGTSELSLRLTSILCMVLFLAALTLLLCKAAGRRAALVTLLLVLGQPVFAFGWLQRPYALILAMTAVAALCWYDATRLPTQRFVPRWLSLPCLVLALALAINSHYFAVFTVVPFLLAETVRSLHLRRFDPPVATALLLASVSAALTLPFRNAIQKYSAHVITGEIDWNAIPRTYALTLHIPPLLDRLHLSELCILALVAAIVFGAAWRLLRRPTNATSDPALWTLVASLTLAPFLTVAFAVFILHAYRDRYTLYQFTGLMLCLGIVLAPWLNRLNRPVYVTTIAVLCILATAHQLHLHHHLQAEARTELAHMAAPPNLQSVLQADPALPIFAPLEACIKEFRYGPALIRAHLRCIYSRDLELRYGSTDTVARTSAVLITQTNIPMVPYDQLITTPGKRLLVHRESEPWEDWIPAALKADGIRTSPLGEGVSGEVLLLSPSK
jgi:hypothetical protein